VADTLDSELAVFLGSHIYFPNPGWLKRIHDIYIELGPGYYGCWGFHEPVPHLRTTAFWLPPELLLSYPCPVDDSHRYRFEHGRGESMFHWARERGFDATMVTRTRVLKYPDFDHVPSEDCIMFDQHTDRHGIS